MKLWLVSQDVNTGYDTYDSMIVAALSEEEAIILDPGGFREWYKEKNSWLFIFADGRKELDEHDCWALVSDLKCVYLGEANKGIKPGIIITSFHAG